MRTAPAQGVQPYKGLVPYTEHDAALFFGRDRERDLIEANLMAARLTVLYGPSGVGKTSVLHAGVIHRLRQQALHNFQTFGAPEFAVVAAAEWAGDPVAAIELAVHQGVLAALGAAGPAAGAATAGNLAQTLRTWAERLNGELLIVLDQFEEYFLYQTGTPADERFIEQFSRAVSDSRVPARFLISLREDALAQLDRFKGRIDGLFDNTLRIDRLDREAAQRAIEGPIERINAGHGDATARWSLEPGLVNDVLDQVQTGRVTFGRDGGTAHRTPRHESGAAQGAARHMSGAAQGAAPRQPASQARVDTPYLQLVMQRLWHEEAAAGSRTLHRATLARLGGAERIVRTHLDGVMAELPAQDQETAHAVFHHLVTPSGMKIAHRAADLAQYTGQAESDVERLLDALSRGQARVLRPVASADEHEVRRYEIHHDVLAAAILDWRQRYAQRQTAAAAAGAQRSQQRVVKLLACVATLPVLMLVQGVLGFQLGGRAEEVFAAFASVLVNEGRGAAAASEPLANSLLAALLKPEVEAGRISVVAALDRSTISVHSDGVFEPADAVLAPQNRPLFERIGQALNQTTGPILVTAHTDNVPLRTLRHASNWQLSQARADAVKTRLADTVLGDRLRAEGRADSEPIADNATPEGRARNRRVEITVFAARER